MSSTVSSRKKQQRWMKLTIPAAWTCFEQTKQSRCCYAKYSLSFGFRSASPDSMENQAPMTAVCHLSLMRSLCSFPACHALRNQESSLIMLAIVLHPGNCCVEWSRLALVPAALPLLSSYCALILLPWTITDQYSMARWKKKLSAMQMRCNMFLLLVLFPLPPLTYCICFCPDSGFPAFPFASSHSRSHIHIHLPLFGARSLPSFADKEQTAFDSSLSLLSYIIHCFAPLHCGVLCCHCCRFTLSPQLRLCASVSSVVFAPTPIPRIRHVLHTSSH